MSQEHYREWFTKTGQTDSISSRHRYLIDLDSANGRGLSLQRLIGRRYRLNLTENHTLKRYDSIGSAPAKKPLAKPKRVGPGHFRLGRLNEAAGVWGRRRPLLEFESIFHWKSLTTGLFYEHSKYGASLRRLPLLNREGNRSQREPERASTNEHA